MGLCASKDDIADNDLTKDPSEMTEKELNVYLAKKDLRDEEKARRRAVLNNRILSRPFKGSS